MQSYLVGTTGLCSILTDTDAIIGSSVYYVKFRDFLVNLDTFQVSLMFAVADNASVQILPVFQTSRTLSILIQNKNIGLDTCQSSNWIP